MLEQKNFHLKSNANQLEEIVRKHEKQVISLKDKQPLPDYEALNLPAGIEIAWDSRALEGVGGDVIIPLNNTSGNKEYIDLILADVTGHGISANFGVGKLETVVSILFGRGIGFEEETDSNFISELDFELEKQLPSAIFFTMIYARFFENGQVTIVSCGHNPAIYCSKENHTAEYINREDVYEGTLLGILRRNLYSLSVPKTGHDYEKPFFEPNLKLEPGDSIILYTDGITELDESHYKERLLKQCNEMIDASPKEIVETVMYGLKDFDQKDDQTIIVVKKEE